MSPGSAEPAAAGGRILRNSLLGMVARAVDMVMRMAIVALIARYLGTAGFGEFAFVMATTAFVLALTDFGLEPILVRDINRPGADRPRIVGGILALRLAMGAAVLAGMAAVVALSDWPAPVRLAMCVTSVSQVLMAGQMVMLGVFRAHERMEYDTATSLIYQCVSLGLTAAAVVADAGLFGIVLAQLASETLKLALLTRWVQLRVLRLRLVWDRREMAYYLKEALPIIGMALATVVSFRLNVLVLKAWRGAEDIALFDSSHRLILSITMIPLMIVVAVFPALCRMAGQDRQALRSAYATAVKYLLILGLAATVGLALWAEPILRLLYGPSFVAGAASMRWLALSVVAGFLIPLTNYVMTSIGRQGPSIAGVLAGVVVNLVVDLFLVPSRGHVGAAVGFSAGTIAAILVNGALVRRMLGPAHLAAVAWRPLAAAALMAAVGAGVGTGGGLRAVLGLLLGAATYAGSLLALRAVTVGELATLRAMRRAARPEPPRAPPAAA
jgi:O-antigen/teichoic acid export membrane protein